MEGLIWGDNQHKNVVVHDVPQGQGGNYASKVNSFVYAVTNIFSPDTLHENSLIKCAQTMEVSIECIHSM